MDCPPFSEHKTSVGHPLFFRHLLNVEWSRKTRVQLPTAGSEEVTTNPHSKPFRYLLHLDSD